MIFKLYHGLISKIGLILIIQFNYIYTKKKDYRLYHNSIYNLNQLLNQTYFQNLNIHRHEKD